MASIQRKPLDEPDETRPVDKGKVEVVALEAGTVMRTTFEPGWRWSECVKPVVGDEPYVGVDFTGGGEYAKAE